VSEDPDKCECPYLRMAAQESRMAECGIIHSSEQWVGQDRIHVLLVAQARTEYGCKGPVQGRCPYYESYGSVKLGLDPNVPLLKPKIEDGQDHKYI